MIVRSRPEDAGLVTSLALKLWDGHDFEELKAEMAEVISGEDSAVFMFFDGEIPGGFAQCSLRRDYVEGTSTSPVGYLEGIYVDEQYRRRGVAASLLKSCEDWAKERGCTEFASDCELKNAESLQFHLKCGFSEANRIICFRKELEDDKRRNIASGNAAICDR